MENNKKRFNVSNMEIINAELPKGLEKLDMPDRIFIGGGGKNLEQILESAAVFLKKKGIIVINTVLIKNIGKSIKILDKMNFKKEIIQMQVSRGYEMPWDQMLKPENPVFIISGERT